MHLSGQPHKGQEEQSTSSRFNNCSQRTDELSMPKEDAHFKDVTTLTDFRGLVHADNHHALEALYPGYGHELSVEFKKRATESSKPSFPAPPLPTTPRKSSLPSRVASQESVQLTTESVPVSNSRLSDVATRRHCNTLKKHSQAQFLNTAAPPPLDQKKQLLNDDFSPKTTLKDPHRATGNFERTDHGKLSHGPYGSESPKKKGMELLPPGTRSMVYPVLAATSPKAKGAQASGQASEMSFPGSPTSSVQASTSQPNFRQRTSTVSSASSKKGRSKGGPEAPTAAVCRELDAFEDHLAQHGSVSNFFGTPKSYTRSTMRRSASEPTTQPA